MYLHQSWVTIVVLLLASQIRRASGAFALVPGPQLFASASRQALHPDVSVVSMATGGCYCGTTFKMMNARRMRSLYLTENPVDTSEQDDSSKKQKLTPDRVAEMVEVSFVNACLQLAQGYVDVLKLLIVAIKAGYEIGMTPEDIVEKMDVMPESSAGRPLMPEELELRSTWIHIVYLVLDYLGHPIETPVDSGSPVGLYTIDEQIRGAYSGVLPELQEQHARGAEFHVDDAFLSKHSYSVSDPMQKAIVSQTLRVIWLTYTVLNEEEVCLDEKSGLKAQPPIPGAFD